MLTLSLKPVPHPLRYVSLPGSLIAQKVILSTRAAWSSVHFIFLLLIDGSSFFSLGVFPVPILSRIDNAPREHLIENKARFSLFLVFIINISAISVKAGIISENIR